ncbi:MAG: hypothetical protein E6G60_21030 [Actinobacteria bacterium]|nr:MAG: hypothetical protein E6G60_21030 [Actinomycetota bacterium]
MNTRALLRRVMVCVGVSTLAAITVSVDPAAGASDRIRVRQPQATQLTAAANSNVVVDNATADLRQRLRGRAELDQLAESVRFEGAPELSALTLTDEPGAVSITPRATTDAPSRQAVEIALDEPELILWTMGGGRTDSHYPPAAFAVDCASLQQSSAELRIGEIRFDGRSLLAECSSALSGHGSQRNTRLLVRRWLEWQLAGDDAQRR